MSALKVRIPVSPAVLLTFVAATILLYPVYLIAPDSGRMIVMACGGIMLVVIAFTSVELALYLLILSTLLSPEIEIGNVDKAATTTVSRGITIRLDDILLTIISLTWLFRMAASKGLGLVRRTPINQPIVWYWLATALATIVGFSAGRVGMFGFFFVLKYLEYFVLFYVIINQTHDEAVIKRYIMVMLFTCFVVSLAGIAQIPGGERVTAVFEGRQSEPNTLGGYLVLMFAVTLGLFLNEVDKMKRWRLAGLLVLILPPLAFTQSRSSYLGFVIMIGLFILLSRQKRFLIGFSLLALVLLPFVLPGDVINRVAFTFGQAQQKGQIDVGGVHIDTSTSARLHTWNRVLTEDIFKHPLLGVGVTGGRFIDGQYPRVIYETGMIGMVLFLWLLRRIWVLLRVCYRELSDPGLKGMALGTLCGLGGLMIHAIGSNTFVIVRIMEPFMILVGLSLAALLIEQQKAGDGLCRRNRHMQKLDGRIE
ncbi:MAG: O-antigen ligase family protein [Mariprofundaceae bacterium]|nr:O-antigen ligase family protein [Mariprofundaceae bacterium]